MKQSWYYTRREILLRLSWVGVITAGAMALGPLFQYLVNDEDQVQSPIVSVKKQPEMDRPWENVPSTRAWLKRDQAGVMALVATCTHLGCEVRYHPEKKQWECPCHGSIYDEEGRPISGPAPQALPRVAVEIKQDGSLLIQMNEQVGIDERAKRRG